MAYDRKYGRVTTEHGDLGEDEPVIVFRARDKLLPKVIAYYRLFCWKAGSPKRHLTILDGSLEEIETWQAAHPDLVRTPSSQGPAGRRLVP